MKSWVRFFVLCVMGISFILPGCGGSGGGGETPAAPGAPTGVTAVAGPGQARISWDNVTGATSYNLYYSQTAGVTKLTGIKIPNVTSPNIVTPLTNGVPYYFVVTAVNANGESADSSQVSATPAPNPPPAAPTNVAAVAGILRATVSWDNVAGATSYNLYYSLTSGVTKLTGTKVTGVTSPSVVTPLNNGVPYYFVVTAVNANGESADSSQVSATPTTNPPPAPPANVSAAPGSGEATINWTAVAGATSYNIYYSTTSPVSKATGTKVTGVTSPSVVTPLIRGTTYYFVVTAVNADGESVESLEVNAPTNSPNPTYSQGDLTGNWSVQVILTGTTSGWYRFTAAVDSAGNVTITNPTASSGVVIPTIPAWSIISGTGLDNTIGVVKETGVGSNSSFHAKLSSSKTMMAGTSTYGPGTYALHVCLKRSGVAYSDADLANKIFGYNRIFTGASKIWEIASGSINGFNQITITSKEDSIAPVTLPPPNFTTISVNPAGVVTIGNEPNFIGTMSADKKIIVGTSTDSSAPAAYSLRIIQLRGQTYTSADLVGQYISYSFQSESVSFWAHGTWAISSASATQVTVNVTNIFNSDGSVFPALPPWTQIIDAQGGITIAPPGDASTHGLISFGKDMVVYTGDDNDGASMTVTMQ